MSDLPPPSYAVATGNTSDSSHIPPDTRRSMEDENRALPSGWVRQYDPQSHHQFFVDTTKEPPRRIWHHPYDDFQFLSTLPVEESRRISHRVLTDSGMGEDEIAKKMNAKDEPKGLHKFGRHIKDRLTHSTHEERAAQRAKEAEERRENQERVLEEDRKAYEAHLAFRKALSKAQETGQPQLLGKDKNGRDVFVEPPSGPFAPHGAQGYNPYASGPYANPNARFMRPADPYYRPYGYGRGLGLGAPLLGGALLGSLLF